MADQQLPPSSVEAYLRMVRDEARSIPDTMSARPPFTGADASLRPSHQQPLLIPTAATAFSTAGCAPPPAELAPNEQWRTHLASTFASLQLRFQRAMDAWKARQPETAASADIESNPSCPGLPTTNGPDAWFAYCYRPRQTNSAASNDALPLPQAADPLKPSAPTSTMATSLMQVAPGIAQAVFRMEQCIPLTALLDQCQVVGLLQMHTQWLVQRRLRPQECQWLFALLLRLDPLLTAEDQFVLRELCRALANLRARLTDCHDPALAPINIIITIVAKHFYQGDLY